MATQTSRYYKIQGHSGRFAQEGTMGLTSSDVDSDDSTIATAELTTRFKRVFNVQFTVIGSAGAANLPSVNEKTAITDGVMVVSGDSITVNLTTPGSLDFFYHIEGY